MRQPSLSVGSSKISRFGCIISARHRQHLLLDARERARDLRLRWVEAHTDWHPISRVS